MKAKNKMRKFISSLLILKMLAFPSFAAGEGLEKFLKPAMKDQTKVEEMLFRIDEINYKYGEIKKKEKRYGKYKKEINNVIDKYTGHYFESYLLKGIITSAAVTAATNSREKGPAYGFGFWLLFDILDDEREQWSVYKKLKKEGRVR